MRNPTTVAEVVEDIIANMPEVDKANVVNTPENSFITFHHGGVPNRAKGGVPRAYLVFKWQLQDSHDQVPALVRRDAGASRHTCQLLSGK